jgi:hypothetical protein
MIGWIYKKDRAQYENLMRESCNCEPMIDREEGDKIHVSFCSAAASVWHMAGYWFEMG